MKKLFITFLLLVFFTIPAYGEGLDDIEGGLV